MIYHKKRMWREIKEKKENFGGESSFFDSENSGIEKSEERNQYGHTKYTKTDINKMSTTQLQNLAAELGVENSQEKSGSELKKLLIEKFSL